MGGHGAWVTATSHPDSAVCVVSAAGWLRKEDYGDANAFFRQDAGGAYTDPGTPMTVAKPADYQAADFLIY